VDHRTAQVGIVTHALLDEAGERRDDERVVDVLFVEQLDARLREASTSGQSMPRR
jgi:hypothetical protein